MPHHPHHPKMPQDGGDGRYHISHGNDGHKIVEIIGNNIDSHISSGQGEETNIMARMNDDGNANLNMGSVANTGYGSVMNIGLLLI